MSAVTEALSAPDPSVPLAVSLPQASDPAFAQLTIPSGAPTKGLWSPTYAWPLNGLHSVLLPNGRVLTYGTPTGNAATQDGRYFDVWDPSLGFGASTHQTALKADQVNSFCSGATFLDDGRLLVSGGNSPLDSTQFSSATGGVTKAASILADERWYATMITLADGRALILGGSTPYGALRAYQDPVAAINGGVVSMTPEVYTPSLGWSSLFGAYSREAFGPDFHRYWYPHAWVAPNSDVFGISSEKMWSLSASGDGAVSVLGNFKTGASETTRPNIGPTSTAVMFAPGRILQVGGNGYYDGYPSTASKLATVIDINGPAPVVTETGPMAFGRQWANSTVLPTGDVVVTGGTAYANNGGADAVYEAEIWKPNTGTWTTGARAAQIRVYHSAAILLPNGVVLTTGGGAPGPVNNLNAELYYPPYLFRTGPQGNAELAPRPVLTAINALKFTHGSTAEFELAQPSSITRVVLVGTSSVTHSFNTSQRYQELEFLQAGQRVAAAIPSSANRIPPGYYLLVALDANGVPSAGVIVAIGASTASPPVPTLLPRGGQVRLVSTNQPDYSLAVDGSGLGVLKALGATPSSTELASARFLVRDGLADSNCVSLESTATPGSFLRHQGYRVRLGVNDGSALFGNDATFCPEPGLAGAGITLRSKNFPTYALRHRGTEVWIDPVLNDAAFSGDASFTVQRGELGALPDVAAPLLVAGGTASYSPALNFAGATYSWDFGDGTPATAFVSTTSASHRYANAGVYLVTLTVRLADGRTTRKTFVQGVYAQPLATAPRSSSAVVLEPRTSAAARLWVVNPDNATIAVFDTGTQAKVAEIAVGSAPRSAARAPDGRIWVVNRGASTISIVNPSTLAVAQTLTLPGASLPYGVVFAPDGSAAFVTLEGLGQVLKLNPSTGAVLATVAAGPNPRHLAIGPQSDTLLVSRFITPSLPGESGATVQTVSNGAFRGGEVVRLNPSTLGVVNTVVLRASDKVDGSVQGRGVPNYLGAPVIAPDGKSAWVPSKQDNVLRGKLRDGFDLDFQNTVRAVSSRIDLATFTEDYGARIDHDDAGVASAAAFHPTGAYLFVSLETSRQVAVIDAVGKRELFRIEAGRAPQSLIVSQDGERLYVQNFMDRSVGVVDLRPLVGYGEFRAPLLSTLVSVASEQLSAQVLSGKRLFYDARDTRLSRDAYLSCASCHNDGGHDGRVWDLTGLGEGVRNTISLRGRAGAQGLLHWSANFDELQDFEGQIRTLSAGTGLMSDAAFNTGTRSQPLGLAKAGVSADLDALAAYMKSLTASSPSPYRNRDGSLTSSGLTGRARFGSLGCPQCHNGSTYSNEGQSALRNIGTLKPASGSRLGGALTGIDTPTLRDAWATAPYLHDGSAATLAAAISAHNTATISAADANNLAAFVQQIDGAEPGFAPPSGLTQCATENGTCSLPAGRTATVYYGANDRYFSRVGVTGSIACNNATFGDPIAGTRKACRYR